MNRWFRTDLKLFVDGRNQTKLVDGLQCQVGAVRAALAATMFSDVAIMPALCFVGAEWGWRAQPIVLDDVLVVWPRGLVEALQRPGPLDPATIDVLAHHLSSALPASR